jgi:hypothetical protein
MRKRKAASNFRVGVKDKANVIAGGQALMYGRAATVIRNFAKLPQ